MSKELSKDQLAVLGQNYPVSENNNNRLTLPRFGMLSKDLVEETGKGKEKTIKVIQPMGTFYTERDLGEVNEEGKKVWTRQFIETPSVDVIIAFHRKQLKKYDSSLKVFISSPIFDSADQVIPLYLDKQVIKRGTQAELQALYPALTQKGKPTSDLKEEVILFVFYKEELFQLNISQSSKWGFMDYKKALNPSTVVTTLGSVEETFGTNTYHKTTFTSKRLINGEEFELVVQAQDLIKGIVKNDAEKFLLNSGEVATDDKKFVDAGF